MKKIIIDLDNTIIDLNTMLQNFVSEMVIQYDLIFDAKIIKETMRDKIIETYNHLNQIIGNHEFNLYLSFLIMSSYLFGYHKKQPIKKQDLLRLGPLAWQLNDYFNNDIKLNDNAKEFMEFLFNNNYIDSIIVYSNGHGDFQEIKTQEVANQLNMDNFFTDIYVTPKKDILTLDALIKTSDYINNYKDIIVISNRLFDDIIPARQLGLDAIYIGDKDIIEFDKFNNEYKFIYSPDLATAMKYLKEQFQTQEVA